MTTGGSDTQVLRNRFPQAHFQIEDFIPFDEVLPLVDVFISNGGYGGVLQSIQHSVPMVLAGVHEGKNEICARLGYFGYGINLNTEKPKAEKIRKAVDDIAKTSYYKQRIEAISAEFREYPALELFEKYVAELLASSSKSAGKPTETWRNNLKLA